MDTNSPINPATPSETPPAQSPRKPRRLLKMVGVLAGLLLLALVVGVIFAPAIASSLAPGIIASQAAKHVKGSVSLAKADFSWGGPQSLDTLVWKDEQGTEVAKLSLSTSASLTKLATGSLDLGDVKVRDASVRVVRGADGTLNVQKLLLAKTPAQPAGAAPAPTQGIKLPPGLKLALTIDKLDATFIDEAGPGGAKAPTTVQLKDVKAAAVLDPIRPLKIDLTAKATTPSAPGSSPGDITANIAATSWAKPDGTVILDAIDLAANVKLTQLPTALADALLGPIAKDAQGAVVPLARALGETLDATIDARGTMQDANATLTLAMARAQATGDVRVAQGVLTSKAPITIVVQGEALAQLVPALGAAIDPNAASRIDRVPGATLAIEALSMTLPKGGGSLDLRGASLTGSLTLEAMAGQVALGAGQAPQPMTIAPLRASITTPDLAKETRVQLATSARIAGRPAGDIAVDATLSQILSNAGALALDMKTAKLRGTANVTQIATAIAQPFVQQLGLDLPRDVGPVLDLTATAATAGDGGGAGSAIDVKFSATAEALQANGDLTITGEQVRTSGKGVRITADRAGSIAQALTAKNAWAIGGPVAEGGASDLLLDVTKATLVRDATRPGGIALEKSSLIAAVTARGLSLRSTQAPAAAPVQVDDLAINTTIEAGTVRGVVQGSMQHQGQAFRTRVTMDVPGMLIAGGGMADPITLRPRGSVQVDDLPTSLLALASTTPVPAGEPDVIGLVRDLVGPVATITLETKPGEPASALDAKATIQSPRMTLESAALLSNDKIAMQGPLVVQTNLTPEAFAQLLGKLAPQMQNPPRLTAATQARLEVLPLTIPLDAQRKPLLAQGGTLDATLTIPTSVAFDNVAMGEGRVARLGAQGLRLQVQAPLASLIPGASGGTAGEGKLTLKGNLLGNDRPLGAMDASVRVTLAQGKPQTTGAGMKIASTISSLDTRLAESLLGKTGLLSGALGDTAAVWLDASGTMDNADAQLTLQAPNVTTTGPLKLKVRPDRFELAEPARVELKTQPEFLNALMSPKGGGTPALTLTQPATINAYVEKLLLPRGAQGAAPDVSSTMLIPALALRTSDAKTLDLRDINFNARTDTRDGARIIAFGVAIEDAKVQGAKDSGKITMTGAIRNVMDAQGKFDTTNAVLDARGKMPAFPTAIADVFAKQDGLLVDALGPMIDVDLDVRSFPIAPPVAGGGNAGPKAGGGFVDFQARSPRASARITGEVGSGVLTCSQPIEANMLEVTRVLSNRVIKGLPLLGSFEKTPQDAPAVLKGTGVTIPMGSDMTKFNGEFTLDPGEARFGTSGPFSELLNIAGLKTGGVIGRRLQPITVSVRHGIATYPMWTLPLGEVNVQTEGTVDLVLRNVDVVTWIPLGALSDQAAGSFNTGLGNLLGGAVPQLEVASMVPFRTKGPMDNPTTKPDLKLFAETALKNLKPEKLIEKGIGDLLKGIGKKKEPK